jgi:hypothetical protein
LVAGVFILIRTLNHTSEPPPLPPIKWTLYFSSCF